MGSFRQASPTPRTMVGARVRPAPPDPVIPGYQSGAVGFDPNLVVDPRTGVWLAFGSQWSGIILVPIDPATGKPPASAPMVPLASRRGAGPIEAPFLFQRNGYYYLFASFNDCCMGAASTCEIMVGRSASITGPYVARDGRPMLSGEGTPVLAGDALYRGPGHNAVLADGPRDWLVQHTYSVKNGGAATMQLRPLSWTASGWPVAGAPLP